MIPLLRFAPASQKLPQQPPALRAYITQSGLTLEEFTQAWQAALARWEAAQGP